jgi:NADH dehydrogenase
LRQRRDRSTAEWRGARGILSALPVISEEECLKVLVSGGSGVIGTATVKELIGRGHQVRLLSRGAYEASREWAKSVEPFAGDVGDASSLHGAAAGCAAVIHVTGVIEESPPEVTFERINVGGTENIIREAERAGARRLIYVSSLGAERGRSDYHRSKLKAEELVRASRTAWTVVRVGAVMGTGDETVSVLLRMVRMLPIVPVIGTGNQPFQPIWHEDVGWALAECLERADVSGTTLRIAGPDVVTVREVLDVFKAVTDRSPLRVPLPSFLARAGSAVADAVGIDLPVSAATVQMLLEGNYLQEGESNDLIHRLGARPVPTRNRLVELVDDLPEQTPDEGVGRLQRRRFQIDIAGSSLSAQELLRRFADQFAEIAPFEAVAEPGAPTRLEENATLTLELPARGHVQVRVESIDEESVTLATIEGHPLAGIVRFRCRDRADGAIRFTIDVVERPASRIDQISMALIGTAAQARTWKQTAENLARSAGGHAPEGVAEESWDLSDESAEPLEEWITRLVQRRRRNENGPPAGDAASERR